MQLALMQKAQIYITKYLEKRLPHSVCVLGSVFWILFIFVSEFSLTDIHVPILLTNLFACYHTIEIKLV